MGSELFSGIDGKVEIRLFGQNGETTEWFELTQPFHNGFERLSQDDYCVNFSKHSDTIGLLENIGIRNFGSDRMIRGGSAEGTSQVGIPRFQKPFGPN